LWQVFGWGANSGGQLGVQSTSNVYTPIKINFPAAPYRLLACGNQHLLVATATEIQGIGNNSYGQLGIGNTSSRNYSALQMVWKKENGIIRRLCAGTYSSGVLTKEGKVFMCGGSYYMLGRNVTSNGMMMEPAHTTVPMRHFRMRKNYAFAVDENGKLWAWGSGYLGTNKNNWGSTETKKVPTLCVGNGLENENVLDMHNNGHVAVITESGKIYTWGTGSNCLGQGRGSYFPKVANLNTDKKKFFMVTCGYYSTYLLTHDSGTARMGYLIPKTKKPRSDKNTEYKQTRATLPPFPHTAMLVGHPR
jgi:alpha-tubulin suppressor-like RCC1 family protein